MTAEDFFQLATYDSIKNHYAKLNYRFFDRGDYNLNIFGFRLSIGTNVFDDVIGVAYKVDGVKTLKLYGATTDPGYYWLKKLMNKDGCAIMVEGQYMGVYMVGPHGRSKYTALRQCKPIKVYRDGDLDTEHDLDPETIQEDIFYTNLHHGFSASKVKANSAGCQVIQSKTDFAEFIEICCNAAAIWGNSFSYTLFNHDSLSL